MQKKTTDAPVGKFCSPYKDADGKPLDDVDTSEYEVWVAAPKTIHYYYAEALITKTDPSGVVAILIGEGVYNFTRAKPRDVFQTMKKMSKFVKVEMSDKRAIPGRPIVRHFGLRYRNEEQAHTGKDKLSVALKAGDVTEQQHASWCGNMAHVAGAIIDAVRMAEPNLVNTLENLMEQTVEGHSGKACEAYPAASCADNGGYACHWDPSDDQFGTPAGFGKDGAQMALPPYQVMVRMNDGDVMVLNAGGVLHANVSH